MKIGIISAMKLEVDLLLKEYKSWNHLEHSGFHFYSGQLYGQSVVITISGVGKVNAAACTQMLIDYFSVDIIINTGIAGSTNPDVQICDVVLSTKATYHDVRPAQMKNLFPFQPHFTADPKLLGLAQKSWLHLDDRRGNLHQGLIVTGETFISDETLRDSIIQTYAPQCVEMEGAAIAHVAFLNSIPFLIIRSISDNADHKAGLSYEAFEVIAAHQASELLLNMLESIGSGFFTD